MLPPWIPTCPGASVTLNVLSNDSEPDGQPISLTAVSGATNGTVVFTSGGNVTFTPNEGYYGVQVLTYTVCDNTTPTPCVPMAHSRVNVGNLANVPAVANDSYTMAEDAIGSFNVLANDGAGLTVVEITSEPANGRISINTDNTITFIPNADFAGTNTFAYKVRNSLGYTNTAVVNLTITDDACNANTYQTAPGTSGSVALLAIKDTYLNQDKPTENYGGSMDINVNRRNGNKTQRAILKFDVSSIPAGATINSASLRLFANRNGGASYAVDAHIVTNDWTEGISNGAICSLAANWTNRIEAGTSDTPWGAAGGDYNPRAVGTTTLTDNVTGWYSWTITPATVANWRSGSVLNHGFLMKATVENVADDRWEFDSREATNVPGADRDVFQSRDLRGHSAPCTAGSHGCLQHFVHITSHVRRAGQRPPLLPSGHGAGDQHTTGGRTRNSYGEPGRRYGDLHPERHVLGQGHLPVHRDHGQRQRCGGGLRGCHALQHTGAGLQRRTASRQQRRGADHQREGQ